MENIIPQDDTPEKYCPGCTQTKPISEFGKDNRSADKLKRVCKECRHTEYKESLERNPDLHKDKHQKRLAKSLEEQEQLKAYQAAKMREYREKWIASGICTRCGVKPADEGHRHCGECRIRDKEWSEGRRDLWPAEKSKERSKLRREVIESYGNKCQCCGETQYEFLTINHVNN